MLIVSYLFFVFIILSCFNILIRTKTKEDQEISWNIVVIYMYTISMIFFLYLNFNNSYILIMIHNIKCLFQIHSTQMLYFTDFFLDMMFFFQICPLVIITILMLSQKVYQSTFFFYVNYFCTFLKGVQHLVKLIFEKKQLYKELFFNATSEAYVDHDRGI